jgi:hemoglobin-like flavoprotein
MNFDRTSDLELIHESLELAATVCGDPAPLVYKYLYASRPQVVDLFGGDVTAEGRMFYQVLNMVFHHAEGRDYVESNLKAEVSNHEAYGVSLDMYEAYFQAIIDAMHQVLGNAWPQKYGAAWQRNLQAILLVVQLSHMQENH